MRFALAMLLVGCDEGKAPVEEGVEREELGTFTTDAEGVITFEADPPVAAISSLVYCGPYGYDLDATAETVTAPDGTVVWDEAAPDATAMRVDTHADILPILLPVSPDLELATGVYGYRVRFESDTPVTATCTGVYRVEPVEAEPTVDLDFVFVGVDAISPELTGPQGDDTLAGVLDEVGAIWAGAGLSIGTVTYADFEGDVATYTVLEGDAEIGDLLRTVEADARTVTVFLVQDITDDEGSSLLGWSGAPGLTAVGGTSKSGIVVNAASFVADPSEVARVIAHETGHFLGLFHTTDKDGLRHDPLADTPECTTDTSGDGVYAPNECEGTGAENLMFWTFSETGTSADQAWVLARSAATR